ncbi:hypothetical protein CHU98_g10381 [Xylaria longipes]|nr:hypothetical protein CHU98_g10381 [Xylaria longipes]
MVSNVDMVDTPQEFSSRLYREAHPEEFQDAPTGTAPLEPSTAAAHPTAESSSNPFQVLDTEETQVQPPVDPAMAPEIVVIPPTQSQPSSLQPGTRPGMQSENVPRRDQVRAKKKAAKRKSRGAPNDDNPEEMDCEEEATGPPQIQPQPNIWSTSTAPNAARPRRSTTNPDYTYAHAYDGVTAAENAEGPQVLIQEPWCGRDGESKIVNHPKFAQYVPLDSWTKEEERPRAITYVRKSPFLKAKQTRPSPSRDIVWVSINGIMTMNVYRQPREPDGADTTQILTGYIPPPRCVVAGDMNAKSVVWQPGYTGHLNGGQVGVATHQDGNVLDITFSNIPFATAEVNDTLHCGTDHAAILTTLPTRGEIPPDQFRLTVPYLREPLFINAIEMGSPALPTLSPNPTGPELDTQARKLADLINTALSAVGKKKRDTGHAAVWWDEDCAKALIVYKAAQRAHGTFCRDEAHAFRATVRRAKKKYWQETIDEVKSDADMYRLMSWRKLQPNFKSPPLNIGGRVVEDVADKAQALRNALLGRFSASDDLEYDPLEAHTVPRNYLPWDPYVSMEELEAATIKPKNTAPGIDACSVKLIKLCWESIKEYTRKLFQACLTIGHFPEIYKTAEVVILRKPNKKDYTNAKSWRPISLLSCIGKGLERLFARRLARISLNQTNLEEHTTEPFPLECGLPQGSPTSPVLFLLYMAEVLLVNTKQRFGYADDLAMLRIGPSLEQNAELIGQDVAEVLQWGKDNKVGFEKEKTELIHFTRAKDKRTAPSVYPPGFDFRIDQVKEPALRWLSVWFDRRLTFRQHVKIRAATALAVARHVKGLANTVHGPPAAAIRKAVNACVIPVLTYGAEAWYPGLTKPPTNRAKERDKDVSTRIQGHLEDIGRALKVAIRAVRPVWRTTPSKTLYRDSGLPTAEVALEISRGAGGYQRARTRLQATAAILPDFPRPKLLIPRFATGSTTPIVNASKEQTADEFNKWYQALPSTHVTVFSDGSKSQDRAVGYGYAIYRDLRIIAQGKGRLGIAEVFDGEAEGARHGLRHAAKLAQGQPIHVCIDNTSVILGLRGEPADSSQEAFLDLQDISSNMEVHTHWTPGHENIEGNEMADKLAKEGSKLPIPEGAIATLAGVKRLAKQTAKKRFADWWAERIPAAYAAIGLSASLKCPEELQGASRQDIHRILAARSGHGDFSWYHRKFNHSDHHDCSCGRIKTPQHLVFCRKSREMKNRWPKIGPTYEGPQEYWRRLIADPVNFYKFIRATSFYQKICPRYPQRTTNEPVVPQPSDRQPNHSNRRDLQLSQRSDATTGAMSAHNPPPRSEDRPSANGPDFGYSDEEEA